MSRFKAAAYSIDGRTFAFSGPVMTGIRPGSYAAIETPGGEQHLGQILDLHPEPGATFAEPTVRGTGRLLSESADDPFMNATLSVAEPALVRSRLPADGDEGAVQIGALADVGGVPAVLRAPGFGRHTFVCGQSGSGKTYSMGVVLERLLHHTSLRIVVLDPISDYVRIGFLAAPSALKGGLSTLRHGTATRRSPSGSACSAASPVSSDSGWATLRRASRPRSWA